MPPQATCFLQRIQDGLPLSVRVEREQAWLEDRTGEPFSVPVRPTGLPATEGIYEATLEVARGRRFLSAEEIRACPLEGWLANRDEAVRLVVNRTAEGDPLSSVPFHLEGIEVVARPTLTCDTGSRAWKMACLLPCREVRIWTGTAERSWRVFSYARSGQELTPPAMEPVEEAQLRDRFSDLAAALPTRPLARPYGSGGGGTRKQGEDWERFKMGRL